MADISENVVMYTVTQKSLATLLIVHILTMSKSRELVWKTWKCQGIWQLSGILLKIQGNVREKILSRKSCLKLFIVSCIFVSILVFSTTLWFKKNAPTSADYNYDPVQSIFKSFSKLFVNDHKSCLVIKFSTSPHICCHYTLWNTMLHFALITLLIARNAPTSDHHITSISAKEF